MMPQSCLNHSAQLGRRGRAIEDHTRGVATEAIPCGFQVQRLRPYEAH